MSGYRPTSYLPALPTQARLLSSGTIGSMTGKHLYSEIEKIQADFTDFCEENENVYKIWQEAWKVFWPLYETFNK